jgi:hypothetical protein
MNQEETNERMRDIGYVIKSLIPPGWGFSLFVFPLEDREGKMNYISTAKREQFLKMIKNFYDRNIENKDVYGSHDTDDLPPI